MSIQNREQQRSEPHVGKVAMVAHSLCLPHHIENKEIQTYE